MSAEQPTIEFLQRENATLRERVAELEGRERELSVYRQILDKASDGVTLTMLDGTVSYVNPAWAAMSGLPAGGVGLHMSQLVVPEERGRLPGIVEELMARGSLRTEWTMLRADGSTFPGEIAVNLISDSTGTPQALAGIVRDLSEQRQAEEERGALQEQVIDAQRAALREVSTPLIPLADDVVVMPLVGAIDSARAQQIMEVLLEGIAHYQADTVLVDISGVRVVDTQVADALLRAARAVQLLGAEIILTGISADVAQTIVHLGADMGRILTRANLQDGLRYALEERTR